MATFRKVVAIGVFLFGTMFLWRTAAINGGARSVQGRDLEGHPGLGLGCRHRLRSGGVGILKTTGWWEPIAVAAAIVGMAWVIPTGSPFAVRPRPSTPPRSRTWRSISSVGRWC
jgi:hypothetical protein